MFELYYGSVTATVNKQNIIIFMGEVNLIHLGSRDGKFLVFAYFTITTSITYVWFSEERVVTTNGKSEVSLNVKTLNILSIFRDESSPKIIHHGVRVSLDNVKKWWKDTPLREFIETPCTIPSEICQLMTDLVINDVTKMISWNVRLYTVANAEEKSMKRELATFSLHWSIFSYMILP